MQPQYAYQTAPMNMPMYRGGGLASLPVQRFQSGGITMGGLTAPMGSIMGVNVTPMDVVSLFAPNPVSVVNSVINAYNAFTAKQEPAPVMEAKTAAEVEAQQAQMDADIAAAQDAEDAEQGQAMMSHMAAMQAQEQEDAANNAAVSAAVSAANETSAMDQGIGGIAEAMGMGTTSGVGGGFSVSSQDVDASMDAGDPGGGGGGSTATGGSDTSSTGSGASDTGAATGGWRMGGRVMSYQQGGQIMNYAQGGLPSLANNMASRGRYGDSMLVHMSPQEVQGLQRLAMANGTSLSINPYTGMPEAFSLKRSLKKLAKFVAPILPFIPIPGLAGLSPLITKALLSTAVGGLSGKKGFDLKRGLMSGLTTYGIGSLAQGAGAAANANAGANIGDIGAQQAADSAISINAVPAGPDFTPGTMMDATTGDILPPPDAAATAAPKFVSAMPEGSSFTDYVTQTGQNIKTAGTGLYDTVTGAPGARAAFTSGQAINPFTDKPISVGTAAGASFTGVAGMKTLDELDKAKAEADKILQDAATRTEEEKEYARNILRNYPVQYRRITGREVSGFGMAMGGRINSYDDEPGGDDGMMQGGIAALAKGGLPPRYLRGGGDGMSDSIRANIEGKQEARLADGEFVVPADVVSHLGNGSSNAGAKKLYSMMDRVRRSRTGKTRQAPQVNTRRMMPA